MPIRWFQVLSLSILLGGSAQAASSLPILCIGGNFAPNGSISELGGSRPEIALIETAKVTLLAITDSSKFLATFNRNQALDRSLVETYGISQSADTSDTNISADWEVMPNETAHLYVDQSALNGSLTINTNDPTVQGSRTTALVCSSEGTK